MAWPTAAAGVRRRVLLARCAFPAGRRGRGRARLEVHRRGSLLTDALARHAARHDLHLDCGRSEGATWRPRPRPGQLARNAYPIVPPWRLGPRCGRLGRARSPRTRQRLVNGALARVQSRSVWASGGCPGGCIAWQIAARMRNLAIYARGRFISRQSAGEPGDLASYAPGPATKTRPRTSSQPPFTTPPARSHALGPGPRPVCRRLVGAGRVHGPPDERRAWPGVAIHSVCASPTHH
jgi:hypothetical protein